MKKIIISLCALISVSASSLFAQGVDLKAEFKFDQEEALVKFVNSWLKPESADIVNNNLAALLGADTRYRQVVGDTGLVTKILTEVSKAKNASAADKLNLFMMSYFKEKQGLEVDTRSVFSKAPYSVKR